MFGEQSFNEIEGELVNEDDPDRREEFVDEIKGLQAVVRRPGQSTISG